jgi:hypothetical protein
MKKFVDVLSRWAAGELSMMEAASCWGCRSGRLVTLERVAAV